MGLFREARNVVPGLAETLRRTSMLGTIGGTLFAIGLSPCWAIGVGAFDLLQGPLEQTLGAAALLLPGLAVASLWALAVIANMLIQLSHREPSALRRDLATTARRLMTLAFIPSLAAMVTAGGLVLLRAAHDSADIILLPMLIPTWIVAVMLGGESATQGTVLRDLASADARALGV